MGGQKIFGPPPEVGGLEKMGFPPPQKGGEIKLFPEKVENSPPNWAGMGKGAWGGKGVRPGGRGTRKKKN